MNLLKKSVLVTVTAALAVSSCKAGPGPAAPNESTEFIGGEANASFGSPLPIGSVEGQDIVLGNSSAEASNDGTQGPVSSGSNQQTPPANGEAGAPAPASPAPPASTPAPFYPAHCAAIKAAKPNSISGVHKIYLNAAEETRVGIDASCDMTEDGGGWTLVLNYSHRGATNPPLALRNLDLPILGGDTLGTDESALVKNWGHATNAMLANFTMTELRFYCRSSQTARVIHFKSKDAGCISAAKTGNGTCLNVRTGFTGLSGHTGNLPASADTAKSAQGNLVLTRDPFTQNQAGNDSTWTVSGNNSNAWECDFGSNNADADTIHRVWFR